MAILIDPPAWPAHGTLWSHLVSDTNLQELHRFAAELKIPRRSFDMDHYDLPENMYLQAIQLGAKPVSGPELVKALTRSGLRIKQADKTKLKPLFRQHYLRENWQALGEKLLLPKNIGSKNFVTLWEDTGEELLQRWGQKHRHYHDLKHLEDVLLSLNILEVNGEKISTEIILAAWFHDAVYDGAPRVDEEESAALATAFLNSIGMPESFKDLVSEMILATDPAREVPHKNLPEFAPLLDSDLWVLASPRNRYFEYTSGIKKEYSHVPDNDFIHGRTAILKGIIDQDTIYKTDVARRFWEERARNNLASEIASLTNSGTPVTR